MPIDFDVTGSIGIMKNILGFTLLAGVIMFASQFSVFAEELKNAEKPSKEEAAVLSEVEINLAKKNYMSDLANGLASKITAGQIENALPAIMDYTDKLFAVYKKNGCLNEFVNFTNSGEYRILNANFKTGKIDTQELIRASYTILASKYPALFKFMNSSEFGN